MLEKCVPVNEVNCPRQSPNKGMGNGNSPIYIWLANENYRSPSRACGWQLRRLGAEM